MDKRKLLAIGIGVAILAAGVAGFVRTYVSNMDFSSNSLIFAAVGDPHYGWSGDQNADEIVNAWMNDRRLPGPEFAINIGDFTHFGSSEGYQVAMKDSFGKYMLPWMFLFGNHDTADYKTGTGRDIFNGGAGVQDTETYDKPHDAIEAGKNYTGVMGRNYAFLWDNILFLFFGDMGNTMLLTEMQRQWLEYMTDLYSDKTTITVSHQGFYPQASNSVYRYYNNLTWWEEFIGENPQMALHIHGHNHEFFHYTYHGLDAIDVGITNEMGKPWTVYFEITESAIKAGIYNVARRRWAKPHFFKKDLDTGWQDTGISWYSVSKRVQDGQIFEHQNRILAQDHDIQLIGSGRELVQQNRHFGFWGNPNNELYWIGYDEDADNGNQAGYAEFHGIDSLSTSTSPAFDNQVPLGWYTKWTEGKVPDSTTPRAIPAQQYRLRARIRAEESINDAMDISVCVLGENLSRVVMDKTAIIPDIDLTKEYQWFDGVFSIPDDQEAWIMKTTWDSKKPDATVYLDEWSVTRLNSESRTRGFNVSVNGHDLNHSGYLDYNQHIEFNLPMDAMQNSLRFVPSIGGSNTGLIRLIYQNPVLWSDDLSIGIDSVSSGIYRCSFEKAYTNDINVPLSLSVFNQSFSLDDGLLREIKGFKSYTLDPDLLSSPIDVKI